MIDSFITGLPTHSVGWPD